MSESDDHRAKADEYARLAREAPSAEAGAKFRRMEQSYRLLARNADWIAETAAFLKELRAAPVRPWSGSGS